MTHERKKLRSGWLQSAGSLAIALVFVLSVAQPGCQSVKKSELANENDQKGGGCDIYVPPSLQQQFDQSKDVLKESILRPAAGPTTCLRTDNRYNDFRKMLEASGCKFRSRWVVSEEAHYRALNADGKPVLARFVDRVSCNNDRLLFLSGVNKKMDKFEIISSDSSGTLHFYTQTPGPQGNADFSYHGSSFHQAPVAEMSGTTGSHPCTRCHISGGLVMKELREPWANWHGPSQGQFRFGSGLAFQDPVTIMKNLNQGSVAQAEPFFAEALETEVKASLIGINKERIRRLKAGEAIYMPQHAEKPSEPNLRHLLRPLFCETEINLVSQKDSAELWVPVDLYLSRLLMPLKEGQRGSGGFGGPFIKGTGGEPGDGVGTPILKLTRDGESRLRAEGGPDDGDLSRIDFTDKEKPFFEFKTLDPAFIENYQGYLNAQGIATPAAAAQRHSKFHGIIPSRSFADDDFVSRLVAEGMVEEKLALAVLMVDFPNPVFSTRRCTLLEKIPSTPLASFKTGETFNAAAITEAVRSSMATNKGASEELLSKLKSSNAQLATQVSNYLDRCRDKANALIDPAKAYRLMRAKNQRLVVHADEFALEGFVLKMFPDAEKLKAQAYKSDLELGLTEQCSLSLP